MDFEMLEQMAMVVQVLSLALAIVVIVAMWIMFQKAGQPGWASIIPIYNLYVLMKVAGKPGWWWLLLLIPVVNLIISIMVSLAIAERFGKGGGFGIGLWLLPFIFYPILAFGSASYLSDQNGSEQGG